MNRIRRALLALTIPAAITAATLPGAQPAQAQGIDHYEQECCSSPRALGGNANPGDSAKEVSNPGRQVYFEVTGVDSQGRTFGFLHWSATNVIIAATNDCSHVTGKTSDQSFGTVITWADGGSGTHRWLFRACNYNAMSGQGSVGSVMLIDPVGHSGDFQRFVRVNP